MTEQQRAAYFREQSGLWFFALYAGVFLGCAVANDVLQWDSGIATSRLQGYLMPLVVTFAAVAGTAGLGAADRCQPR
ncbi:MAG TPA: hypothetical protein VG099_25065 [Gemmataceae bacterium]|jgi:hypothetical protein|nr:hypothetical protein [Gemmataceae bacterium]HEV3447933.1 hypothetical protein [Gemmataceae bacterium]